VSVLVAVVVLLAGAMDASAANRTPRVSAANDGVEAQVIALLNGIRAQQGLPSLRTDASLNQAADSHSRGMVTTGVFSHDSASGTPCDVRIRRFENARLVGETIAWLAGTPSAQQAQRTVELWMNSPPHRQTLLTAGFRRIGVSRQGGKMFGRQGVAFTADLAG
jgi:uncharacterized protein YkwD